MSGFLTPRGRVLIVLLATLSVNTVKAQDRAVLSDCSDVASAETCYQDGLKLAGKALQSSPVDPATLRRALERFSGACRRGLGEACYVAGRLLAADTSQTPRGSIAAGEDVEGFFHAGCDAPERPSAAACNALSITSKYSEYAGYSGHSGHSAAMADDDSALHHLQLGCERANPTACALAAAFFVDWTGPATRTTTVRARLERAACTGGSTTGCIQVADRTRTLLSHAQPRARATPGYHRDRSEAFAAYRDACTDGLSTACTRLGAAFMQPERGYPARLDSAARYFQLACPGYRAGQGDTSSWVADGAGCTGMGRLLLQRSRPPPDTAAAVTWFRDGCALLDSDSCAEVAYHGLQSGTVTVEVALLRALTACFEESGHGCWVAAWLYEQTGSEGRGNAQEYLRQACDLAYAPGCTALAGMLGDDRVADAFKHLRRACVLGDGAGCAAYGSLLASRDAPGEAYYRVIACENGHAPACWELMQLASEAGREVEAGELRSRTCRLDPAYCKRPS